MSEANSIPPDGFRVIPGFPRYAINSRGVILSVYGRASGSKPIVSWDCAKQKHPATTPTGYRAVVLYHDGAAHRFHIHTLVLTLFGAPRPNGMQCRHLDGNPDNNTIDNLAWGTAKQNGADKVSHGTSAKGDKHGMVKLTVDDVTAIRQRRANGERRQDLATEFKVSQSTIYNIVSNRNWKHV